MELLVTRVNCEPVFRLTNFEVAFCGEKSLINFIGRESGRSVRVKLLCLHVAAAATEWAGRLQWAHGIVFRHTGRVVVHHATRAGPVRSFGHDSDACTAADRWHAGYRDHELRQQVAAVSFSHASKLFVTLSFSALIGRNCRYETSSYNTNVHSCYALLHTVSFNLTGIFVIVFSRLLQCNFRLLSWDVVCLSVCLSVCCLQHVCIVAKRLDVSRWNLACR